MNVLSPRLDRAIRRAALLHKDQKRKDGETPYIAHLVAVMYILAKYTDDEDVLIAGLMHDTVEDVAGYTNDDLAREWGARVAAIVEGVTHDGARVPPEEKARIWEIRQERMLEKLQAAPLESLMVKVADSAHNFQTMVEEYAEHGDAYLTAFKEPIDVKLRRAEGVVTLATDKNIGPIVGELEQTFIEAKAAFAAFIKKV